MYTEEQKRRRREATRRWRERNPDKVQEANRRPRKRTYNSVKVKAWRERRLAEPEYRENINRQANKRATFLREWLSDYKADKGCIDCGFSDHRALDFDHVKGIKRLNLSFAKSISQARTEIKKCEVRCSNCHRIRSHQVLQARKSL